jgi:hypothetical protein
MNWGWTTSLDQLLRSQGFPMWLPLGAAGFFGIILLIILLRAERSVANGVLAVITLLAIGVAVAVTRDFAPGDRNASVEARSSTGATSPALSCVDDLAGETVLVACEKSLFGSAESTAAAVSYAASQLSRLTAYGDVATANKNLSYELLTLRRAIERDRYGLMAQVLVARDQCSPAQCAALRSLTDPHQIVVNMAERTYDTLVSHYAPSWNTPAAPVAAFSSMPTGKPTNADFPSAASTPPVNIMTPEPGSASRSATSAPAAPRPPAPSPASPPAAPASAPPSAANAALLSPRPTSAAAPAALSAAKKPAAPKPSRAAAPVQLAPGAPASSTAADD